MKHSAVPGEKFLTPTAQPFFSTVFSQPWAAFAAVLVVNALLLALLAYLERFQGIDHWNLVRDTNAIARQPGYFGAYSNLGVLVWAAAASVALFGWLLLRKHAPRDARVRVLCLGGLFAAIAGLDDLFMLHEHSYVVGISDKVVMAAYALFLLAFTVSIAPVLHKTKWLLLFAALGSFAVSFILDMTSFPGSVLVEEVSKLTGISFLAAYLLTLSWSAISDVLLPQARPEPSHVIRR